MILKKYQIEKLGDLWTQVNSYRDGYLNEKEKNKELNKLIHKKEDEIVSLNEQKKSLLEKLELAGKILKDPASAVYTYLNPSVINPIAAEINNKSNTLWKALSSCWSKSGSV